MNNNITFYNQSVSSIYHFHSGLIGEGLADIDDVLFLPTFVSRTCNNSRSLQWFMIENF